MSNWNWHRTGECRFVMRSTPIEARPEYSCEIRILQQKWVRNKFEPPPLDEIVWRDVPVVDEREKSE